MFTPQDYAYCGIFGALALVLPFFFHLVHLGSIFMPMYLPLMALSFFVHPLPAALTAFIIPLLSGLLTGMPPFYPPVAPVMSIELSVLAALVAWIHPRFPKLPVIALLAGALIIGRFLQAGLFYFCASQMELPAKFVAGISFISGWPGIILMLVVIPPVVRTWERT